jgi:hypothetical protein
LSYGQVRSMKKHRIINQLHTTDKNETNWGCIWCNMNGAMPHRSTNCLKVHY